MMDDDAFVHSAIVPPDSAMACGILFLAHPCAGPGSLWGHADDGMDCRLLAAHRLLAKLLSEFGPVQWARGIR